VLVIPANSPELRNCDIVMKGGITSGIVYPPAVEEIAQRFRFVNIGGTSAGAIAAALTAAAEYRRLNDGTLAGFARLAAVPAELAQNHRLLRLFAPDERTRPLFDGISRVATAPADKRFRTVLDLLRERLGRRIWLDFGWGALPGVVLGVLSVVLAGTRGVPGLLAGLVAALSGGVLFTAWYNGRRAYDMLLADLDGVRTNGYGFSRGVGTDPADDSVLSVWLANLLNEIAGLPASEPLTFGHLWYGRTPTDADSAARPVLPAVPEINLEMVTTCLTHGRPYTFPAERNLFYYDPASLASYVAPNVLSWMDDHQRPSSGGTGSLSDAELGTWRRMPVERDLPVALVTRMSLAVPPLLAAVPLGAVDDDERARRPGTDPNADPPRPVPKTCWFADGGISSNFPIHLFDSPLPRWPTFGINLGLFGNRRAYDPSDQSKNVWMAERNADARFEQWSTISDWGSYASAMLGALKDWNDNLQMRMPGYRDRIVTIGMRDEEGGFNLDMGEQLVADLIARGRAAGAMLVDRFAAPSTGAFGRDMNWEMHRIIRYRVAMSSFQRYLLAFKRGFENPQPGDASYADLLDKSLVTPLPAYDWRRDTTRNAARKESEMLAGLPPTWAAANIDFDDSASPRPAPDLVKRPRA
jgi:predicted acylesterase/phospholipase RssA